MPEQVGPFPVELHCVAAYPSQQSPSTLPEILKSLLDKNFLWHIRLPMAQFMTLMQEKALLKSQKPRHPKTLSPHWLGWCHRAPSEAGISAAEQGNSINPQAQYCPTLEGRLCSTESLCSGLESPETPKPLEANWPWSPCSHQPCLPTRLSFIHCTHWSIYAMQSLPLSLQSQARQGLTLRVTANEHF